MKTLLFPFILLSILVPNLAQYPLIQPSIIDYPGGPGWNGYGVEPLGVIYPGAVNGNGLNSVLNGAPNLNHFGGGYGPDMAYGLVNAGVDSYAGNNAKSKGDDSQKDNQGKTFGERSNDLHRTG